MDEDGRIVYWNIRAEEIFGLSREEAVGRVLADTVIPERLREAHWEGLRRFRETGEGEVLNKRLEMTALRSDGSEFPVELTISALSEPEGWSFHAFVADVSERVRLDMERQLLLDELQHALRGTEERLAVIVDALGEAVTIRGPDDHLIHANRAALDRLGLSSVEALREADPRTLMAGWETFGEGGGEVRMEDLPSVRALRGEYPEPLMMRYVHRGTGEERWVVLKATAIRDSSGSIEAAVTIIEDVTAAKRSSLQMEFLARASQVLASSLDYQETLRNVAGLAVPQIADWCGVDLFDEEGAREPVAVAHVDPSKLEMAERLRAFDQRDIEFAGQIAERAALAVENARLYSERSEVARTLQSSLLPEALPELPGWEIAALYRPAGHESEVGGDFYDFWEVDGDWLMMIGDVTGKGVGAATVTSLVRHTAWAASDFDRRPAAILERVDAALKRRPSLSG